MVYDDRDVKKNYQLRSEFADEQKTRAVYRWTLINYIPFYAYIPAVPGPVTCATVKQLSQR